MLMLKKPLDAQTCEIIYNFNNKYFQNLFLLPFIFNSFVRFFLICLIYFKKTEAFYYYYKHILFFRDDEKPPDIFFIFCSLIFTFLLFEMLRKLKKKCPETFRIQLVFVRVSFKKK